MNIMKIVNNFFVDWVVQYCKIFLCNLIKKKLMYIKGIFSFLEAKELLVDLYTLV